MKKKIFIDGSHGTTGLKIHERLNGRNDLEIMTIPAEKRKDAGTKRQFLNEADVVFFCLPDDAARESASLITNPAVRVIDASTAHRTAEGWVYGIPELNREQRAKIRNSTRVCVPGCYASGFVGCVHPLVSQGFISPDYPVSSYSITGYSGGGRQMIAAFEAENVDRQEVASRPKNLNLAHKHLPEMQKYGLLTRAPLFTPIVGDFFQGMLVFVPIYINLMQKKVGAKELRAFFSDFYKGEQFIRVAPGAEIEAIGADFLSPVALNGTNMLEIFIFGRNDHLLLVARLDNLGKGASGAAVQNMNILIGANEAEGLV